MEVKYHAITREGNRIIEMLKDCGVKLMQNLRAVEDQLEEIKE